MPRKSELLADRETIRQEIKRVDQLAGKGWVSFKDFNKHTGISMRSVQKYYDSWTNACTDVGVKPGRGLLKPNKAIAKEVCAAEILRVSKLVAPKRLSETLFTEHATVSMRPIRNHWGNLHNALRALGLDISEQFYEPVPLEALSKDFLKAAVELGKLPALSQVARRSEHGEYCFSKKHGGYENFKRLAIGFLLRTREGMPPEVEVLLRAELAGLEGTEEKSTASTFTPPHHHGRVLGFRSFPYAPTYEQEVVGLFNAVADELGFEILCNRSAFPDCQAQRKVSGRRGRYKECLIEFELRSGDFKTHGHPADRCHLIVCWEHNWPECPVEVLELSKEIKKLSGWK